MCNAVVVLCECCVCGGVGVGGCVWVCVCVGVWMGVCGCVCVGGWVGG